MELVTKKRVFVDIETSLSIGWFWRTGKQYVGANQVIDGQHTKVISVHWSWEGEDEVHHVHWGLDKQCDKKPIKKIIEILEKADEVVGHNFDRFDLKWIRTRAAKHGLFMSPYHKIVDTYKHIRNNFNLQSYSLKYCCNYFDVEAKEDSGGVDTWLKLQLQKDREAFEHLLYYGDCDIISTKALYYKIQPYIQYQTHYAVKAGLDKYCCPECGTSKVK